MAGLVATVHAQSAAPHLHGSAWMVPGAQRQPFVATTVVVGAGESLTSGLFTPVSAGGGAGCVSAMCTSDWFEAPGRLKSGSLQPESVATTATESTTASLFMFCLFLVL